MMVGGCGGQRSSKRYSFVVIGRLEKSDMFYHRMTCSSTYPRRSKSAICRRGRWRIRCTKTALITLGKEHDRLVKAHQAGKLDQKDYRMHRNNMTIVVQTLWLRRIGDSDLMGYKFALFPADYHYECSLNIQNDTWTPPRSI